MAQATTMDRVAAGRVVVEAEERCALTCACWDCRAYRRHLLKLAAVVVLAFGLGGEAAWQRGLFTASGAPAAVELASASGVGAEAWF